MIRINPTCKISTFRVLIRPINFFNKNIRFIRIIYWINYNYFSSERSLVFWLQSSLRECLRGRSIFHILQDWLLFWWVWLIFRNICEIAKQDKSHRWGAELAEDNIFQLIAAMRTKLINSIDGNFNLFWIFGLHPKTVSSNWIQK